MSGELERKYEVDILKTEEKQKMSKELKAKLQDSGIIDEKGNLVDKRDTNVGRYFQGTRESNLDGLEALRKSND